MKIVSLQASNVKRLHAVEINPDGSLVIIGGRNGQGKSSVLDAIMYALAGKDAICREPVRTGEDQAVITVELDDYTVKRVIHADGSGTITVRAKDENGTLQKSPQTLLDSLTANLAFDPLEFMRMKAEHQLATLKRLVGLDFSALDGQRKQIYNDRTVDGRVRDQLKARLEALPHHPEAPTDEVKTGELLTQLSAIEEAQRAVDQQRAVIGNYRESINQRTKAITQCEQQIAELQQRIARYREEMSQLDIVIAEKTQAIARAVIEDPEPIRAQIRNADAINAQVRENRQRAHVGKEFQDILAQIEQKTQQLAEIDAQKADALAKAHFPVAGLSFGDDGVLLNGHPLDQASSAERLKVSVAMGLALNPKLRVLLIRDGSLLDEDSLRMIGEMAVAHDAQIWIERVGAGEEVSIVIEDGEIVEDRTHEDKPGGSCVGCAAQPEELVVELEQLPPLQPVDFMADLDSPVEPDPVPAVDADVLARLNSTKRKSTLPAKGPDTDEVSPY